MQVTRSTQQRDTLGVGIGRELVDAVVAEHVAGRLGRLKRFWDYYRNEARWEDRVAGGRRLRLAQESGLPGRLRGSGGEAREVVIENDIAWRIHTLVDFMFGRPVVIQSAAEDRDRAARIETFLRRVIECNGGISFFQDLALLGAVYGFVDVLVRVDAGRARLLAGLEGSCDAHDLGACIALETIEGPRAIAIMNPEDYRVIDGYVLHHERLLNEVTRSGGSMGRRWFGGGHSRLARETVTEVWTSEGTARITRRENQAERVERGMNVLGRVPVVHFQNLPQPFAYEGLSEVEPLIPLQDELNTRLSDRANRVTFQSFKMYLGKGIEQFTDRPVGPGQMWSTENLDASIEEFGGDGASPSEEAHIQEIRDAMDKASTVSPLAAGILRGKVGNLTSESALRVTLIGLLARTQKKRVTYGKGIERLCEMILHAADVTGLFTTRPEERGVRLDWPSALPESERQRLEEARLKVELGVPRRQVLLELGYGGEGVGD